jgi:hypothetical protein
MYRDVLNEQRAKVSQEVQTVALLKSRGVGRAIIDDLRRVVYGHADHQEDEDTDLDDDDDRESVDHRTTPLRPEILQTMTNGGANTQRQPTGTNAKTRELARRRKQAFALRGDKCDRSDKVDSEPSIITQSTSNGSSEQGRGSKQGSVELPVENDVSEPWLLPPAEARPPAPAPPVRIMLEPLNPPDDDRKKKSKDEPEPAAQGSWVPSVPTFGLF